MYNEELWFSFEERAKLIVELFINGFGRDDLAVGSVDVAVSAVREDDEDHHVARDVIPVPGEVVDLRVEFGFDQISFDRDFKAEIDKQLLKIVDVVLKIKCLSKFLYFSFISLFETISRYFK